jgi:tetratricopeptide (TPR) repeat protein
MRFIRGDTLKDAIEQFHEADIPGRDPGERTLELRKLLGRFLDVCNAIEYAHSRGVLHRDLKPGNIMLGKYGETLVVDWGLAKPINRAEQSKKSCEVTLRPSSQSDSAPTQLGVAIGTPAYMSPEQASGRLEQLGPTSDVYSLGATLYSLLTGQPAFDDFDVEAALQKVRAGEFERPRQVKKQTPVGLEAICLKAMALNPQARYPSARALADDVEHWLADEPVAAHTESLSQRLGRFGRRHRAWTRAAAAALVLVATITTLATILVNQQRRRAERLASQNEQLAESERGERERADTKAAEAVVERERAEEQARIAADRYALALDTFNTLVSSVQEQLESRPGTQELRQKLLTTAAEGIVKLQAAREGSEDSTRADRTTAYAHEGLGNVFMTLGDLERAKAEYQVMHEIMSRLAASNPKDARAQRDLSASLRQLGEVAYQNRKGVPINTNNIVRNLSFANNVLNDKELVAARTCFERALEIDRRLAAADPDDRPVCRALSESLARLGAVASLNGDLVAARTYWQQALEIVRELAAADPADAGVQRDLFASFGSLGQIARAEGDLAAARAFYEQARAIMPSAESSSISAQRDVALLLY